MLARSSPHLRRAILGMRSVATSTKPHLAIAGVTGSFVFARATRFAQPELALVLVHAFAWCLAGAVGQEFLRLLEERQFPFSSVKMLASARSAGKKIDFMGKDYTVEELTERSFEGVDIALFSAGGDRSRQFAPAAVRSGCVVVDNSSAYRMDPSVPLVVPEVNPHALKRHKGIIANPNCSTIIMNVAVHPLHKVAPVERVVCATYQAASGAGAAAMEELEQQARDWVEGKPLTQDIFKRQYIWNLFSHNSSIDPVTGYNEEEIKVSGSVRWERAAGPAPTKWRGPLRRTHWRL